MLIIFFDIKRIVTKNSSWQVKQPIPNTTVTFYGDCMKICKDFAPNLDDKELAVASQQRTVSHFLFHQGIFDRNNVTVVSTHPTFAYSPS
jgi:hypothetical protein